MALVVAAVCCLLRDEEFRFGDPVKAVQGSLLDVDVLPDHESGLLSANRAKQVIDGYRLTSGSITPFFAGERLILGQLG